MKGFGTFDTTNTLYGSFYSREQDPITNIPKFIKPNMEEQFYERTIEMQKGYYNRYAHLYKDPTDKPIYNPIDDKAFKEEDAQRQISQQEPENINIQNENTLYREMPENQENQENEEPIMRTFHRNYESQEQQ